MDYIIPAALLASLILNVVLLLGRPRRELQNGTLQRKLARVEKLLLPKLLTDLKEGRKHYVVTDFVQAPYDRFGSDMGYVAILRWHEEFGYDSEEVLLPVWIEDGPYASGAYLFKQGDVITRKGNELIRIKL